MKGYMSKGGVREGQLTTVVVTMREGIEQRFHGIFHGL